MRTDSAERVRRALYEWELSSAVSVLAYTEAYALFAGAAHRIDPLERCFAVLCRAVESSMPWGHEESIIEVVRRAVREETEQRLRDLAANGDRGPLLGDPTPVIDYLRWVAAGLACARAREEYLPAIGLEMRFRGRLNELAAGRAGRARR